MKIFITGGNGMVGSNLKELAPKNIEIVAPTKDELDLLNYQAVLDFIKKENPDMIIHAAGIVGGIQANIENPVKFLVDNTDLGRNIFLAAREIGIKRAINLGSSCMYPKNAKNPLTEDTILKGELEPTNEGYAISKIYTQRLCAYINKENQQFNYKTLIPCNLYGKYDKFDPKHSHMIPSVIRKIHEAKLHGEKYVEIWGDGSARREFMFASDLTHFIWSNLDNFNNIPNLMNVGLGYDFDIKEYYQTIAEVIGYSGEFIYDLSKPIGMKQKLVDISLQKKLNWAPKYSLKEGIKITYDYFLKQEKNTI